MKALLILFLTAIVVLFAGLLKKRDLIQSLRIGGTLAALIVTVMDLY